MKRFLGDSNRRRPAAKSAKRNASDDAVRRARHRPRLDPRRVRRFQRALLAWYRRQGRDLPWRRTRDPWAILVSEVMLQQTQVRRVLDYYPRFLARYPTAAELAAARPGAVRQSWAGLGYYRRAVNLHRAARLVQTRHGGDLPASVEALARLPGIGRYTAGAVVCFAFGAPASILDTNAARVLARIFGHGPRRGRTRRLWAIADRVLPPRRAYAFNQAIMDLGATVCTARRPRCGGCPVRRACSALARRDAVTRTRATTARGAPPRPG